MAKIWAKFSRIRARDQKARLENTTVRTPPGASAPGSRMDDRMTDRKHRKLTHADFLRLATSENVPYAELVRRNADQAFAIQGLKEALRFAREEATAMRNRYLKEVDKSFNRGSRRR